MMAIKKYSLNLPENEWEEVTKAAREKQTTRLEIIRRTIEIGLWATKIMADPNQKLILRDENGEKEIHFL